MYNVNFKFIVHSDHKYAYKVDKHYHDCYEIVYYEKGHGVTTIDSQKYRFEPHSFALIEPNIIHSEDAMIDNVKLIFIGFEIENDNHLLKSGLFKDVENNSQLLNTLKRIVFEFESKPFNYQDMISSLLNQIILDCLRIQNNGFATNNDDQFKYIETFIKYNCMKHINGKIIAESIGYSYDYFRKMFKRHFGVSIKDEDLRAFHNYANIALANLKFDEKIFDVDFVREANDPALGPMIFELCQYPELWGQNNNEPLICIPNIHLEYDDI